MTDKTEIFNVPLARLQSVSVLPAKMAPGTPDTVLADIQRSAKIVVINAKGIKEELDFNKLAKFNEEQKKELLDSIAEPGSEMRAAVEKYFHQGGFRNSAKSAVEYFDPMNVTFIGAPLTETYTFDCRKKGKIFFTESYGIGEMRLPPADAIPAEGTVTCTSTLSLNSKKELQQKDGIINLTSNSPELKEQFQKMARPLFKTKVKPAQKEKTNTTEVSPKTSVAQTPSKPVPKQTEKSTLKGLPEPGEKVKLKVLPQEWAAAEAYFKANGHARSFTSTTKPPHEFVNIGEKETPQIYVYPNKKEINKDQVLFDLNSLSSAKLAFQKDENAKPKVIGKNKDGYPREATYSDLLTTPSSFEGGKYSYLEKAYEADYQGDSIKFLKLMHDLEATGPDLKPEDKHQKELISQLGDYIPQDSEFQVNLAGSLRIPAETAIANVHEQSLKGSVVKDGLKPLLKSLKPAVDESVLLAKTNRPRLNGTSEIIPVQNFLPPPKTLQ